MKPRHYQCRRCGRINKIKTPFGMFITPHLGWRKWIKCKHCGAKRHFQRRVFEPEMRLMKELKETYQVIEVQQNKIEQLTVELDEADNYYCSMIDNLRDDIHELKQKLAKAETETAKKIFSELFSKIGFDGRNVSIFKNDLIEVAKRYGVEE